MKIVEGGTGSAHVRQQLNNGILCGSRHSASGADRAAFNEAADDL
jgi:hypothetical protein